MTRAMQIRRAAGAATTLMLGLALVAGDASSQQNAANSREQLIGTWTLVSAQGEYDGKMVDVFGPNPTGMLIFDRQGHFASQVISATLPRFSSNNRMKGTPEENKAVVQGVIAYYGTYTVPEPGTINLHIVSSSFPNWNRVDQKRMFVITGDEMRYTNPTTSFGAASARLVWKRASAASLD